jgi:transposase
LLLDDDTLRTHYEIYVNEGLEGLLGFNYTGGLSYLSPKETEELDMHLQSTLYSTSKEIAHYIEKKYKIEYTVEGIRGLLHKLNFVFKKTKHLPGKGDLKKQIAFVRKYKQMKAFKSKHDEIYFMDGVHPMHNSVTANGWIKKGTEKSIQANTGRERLNINGLCNAQKIEVIVHEDTSVNAQSTLLLFDKVQAHQPTGKIIIIADNAKYYRSKLVSAYLQKNKRIVLEFLPSYSPNLNLIERLWKFYKKKVLHNKYYEDFEAFKKKSLSFFKNIEVHKEELQSLLADNFYFPILKYSNS